MAGSIRKRGKTSWEVRAYVGKDPATGKKQYATKTVRGTKKEAEVALGRLVAEIDEGRHAVSGGTVGELCEKWFAQAEPDLSPSVAPQYRTLLDNRILPRWGDTPLRRLRTADLDLWYSELRRDGRLDGKGGLSANSVKRIHSVLRRALGQGVKWGWLTTNPAADATLPKVHKQPMTLPDPADVARLIAKAAKVNKALPTYFRLSAATGARRGEMCALRWRNVDFGKRRLTIGHSIVQRAGELIEKDTKTHQVRRVSLDEATVAVLEQHRDRCEQLAADCGTKLSDDAYLFSHEVDFSRPWRPNYATLAFGRLRDDLDLDGVKLHHLRHFSATQLLSLGIDVRTVSGRLGHANASTTLDIYAQFVDQADEKAADALSALLDGDHRATLSHPVRRVRDMQGLIVFDGDDTLWRVEHLYDEARRRSAAVVAEVGLDATRWSTLQREIDVANVPTLGLSRLRFPHSSVTAYEHAAAEAGADIDDDVRERVRATSASVFDEPAPPMPGVVEVLEELGRHWRLALLTQGDSVVQEKRVADSGLREAFELVHIVDRKDEASFASILDEADADSKQSWSVGNSLPSDINPALRLGMSAIWIETHVWAHERREAEPVEGRLLVCDALEDVPSLISQHTLLVP